MDKRAHETLRRHLRGTLLNCRVKGRWPLFEPVDHVASLAKEIVKAVKPLTLSDAFGILYREIYRSLSSLSEDATGTLESLIGEESTNVTYRHHIAALKRQVAELEHKSARLAKRAPATGNEPAVMPTRPVRFVAKGFAAMRKRLGLSAAQLGRLVGASEQSVYNWETKKAVPRKEALAAIVKLRGMGKREAQLRLSVKPKAPTTKRAKVKRK